RGNRMSNNVAPVTMVNLQFKVWDELTGAVIIDEGFEMPEGQAILTIRKMYEVMDPGSGELSANILKKPGTNNLILELTLNRRGGANKDNPGLFESLFRWGQPNLLGAGTREAEVGHEPFTGTCDFVQAQGIGRPRRLLY